MNFFAGLAGIIIGILMLRYVEPFYNLFGRWNWAEQMFTSGGTRTGIKLVAIGIMILSFVLMTGTLSQFAQLLRAPFTG